MALPIVDEKKMALDAAEKFKQMTGHLTATEKQQLIYDVAPDFVQAYGEQQAKPMLDAMQQTVNAPSRDIFSWVKDKWNIGGAAIDGMQQPFIDFFDPSSQWAKENRAERQENLGELSEYQKLLNLRAQHNLAQAKANGEWGIGARVENIMNDPYGQTADLAAQMLPYAAMAATVPLTGGASLPVVGTAMSGIGAVQGVGGARGELYEDTQSRSDEQLQANNEQYRQLRASGMSEQQAKEIVGTNIKDHLGELAATAATSALLERVGAAKIIRGQGGLLKNIAAEVASESLDEGAQTMLANNMKRSNDPNLNIFENVPLAMFDGALMGGMGGGAAALLSPKNATTTATPSTSEQVLQAAEQAAQIQAAQTTTPTAAEPTTTQPTAAQPQSQTTAPDLPPPPPTIDVQTGEWTNGNGNTELNPWETQPPTQSQLQQSAQATTATGKVATGASNEIDIGNTRHAATWEIREASDLGASIDKSSNQFRDRTRAASQAQIQKIAQRPDYRYLGESPTMDYGAPTLAQDGNTIIGGNGRTAGVKQAYAQGTAEDYRNDLIANAEKYGFTPEQIAQFEQPILTRRLHNQVDIEQAAIMSNEGGGLAMSALEQAKADATRLPPLDMFTFSETGSLNTGANRNAISQWVQQFPQNQQAALQDGNGMLSQQGLSRLQNAMLYKAYGDSPTLARQIESTSQESRNIGNALTQSANTVAEANAQIAYGSLHDLGIADDLTIAADLFEQIRAQGMSVSDWLAQEQLIAEIAPSPEARLLVQFFDANVRSAKAIREMIGAYYAEVQNLGNPQQADMFGDNHIPTKLDILNKVTQNETTNPTAQTSHQSAGQSSPIAPDLQPETQSAVRPSDEQSVETGNEINAQQPEKRNAAQEIKNLFDGFAQGVVNGFRKETKELDTDLFNHKIDELAQAYQNGNQEIANQLVTELRQSISAHAKQHGFQMERTGGLGEYRWVKNQPNQSEIRFSRSAMKDTQANIARGRAAMNTAILEQRTIHRAMYNNELEGWVDFEWGDIGVLLPSGKTKRAMGIAHIIESRMRKDNMDYQDVVHMLTERVVNTIAKGKVSNIYESNDGKNKSVFIEYNGNRATLIHRKGSNSWLMNAFELKPTDEQRVSNDTSLPTHNLPTRQRQEVGAVGTDNLTDIQQKINEYRTAIRSGSLKNHADKINIVAREEIIRPENAQDLMNVEGFYNPANGSITLIADSLRNAEHAQFVAWHELAHRKIDVSGAADWHNEIAQAGRHETVRKLADKIQAQRKNTDDPAATNRAIAHEEAIAELYAAHETGDYAALEDKYKIAIPRALKRNMGGFLSRLGEKLAMIWRKITGKRETSSADVYRLLQTLSRANDTKRTENSSSLKKSKLQNIQAQPIDEQAVILQGSPVSIIEEQDLNLPTQGGFQAVKQWASDLFAQQGGFANNPILGRVDLSERSVKDSLAHGKLNPYKNMAFAGVKDVLEKGVIIAKDQNEFKENSYFVAAPVLLNNQENILTVTVREDSTTRRMYIHSIMLKENLLKPRVSSTLEKTSRTHTGSLTSADIHNILQQALTYNSQNSGSLKFSRGTTQAEVEAFTRTGKIEHDPTLINALRGDRTAEYLSGKKTALGKMQDWLIEGFADNLHPVAKWIDGLPISEPLREVFKQSMYRAGGKRDYQNQIIEQRFIKLMNQELARIAKKNKMGLLEVKRLVGLWGSANYAPTANARLLAQAQAELDEAKATGDTAKIRTAQEHCDQRKAAIDGTAAGKTAGGYSNPFAAQVKANVEQHISRDDIQAAMQHVYAMLQYKLDLDLKAEPI